MRTGNVKLPLTRICIVRGKILVYFKPQNADNEQAKILWKIRSFHDVLIVRFCSLNNLVFKKLGT